MSHLMPQYTMLNLSCNIASKVGGMWFSKYFRHNRLLCNASQYPASLRSGPKRQGHDSGNAWNLGKVVEGIA
jgi:hypothetical protein